MPSGGARSRSGPTRDENALRRTRKDDKALISLPSEGRPGDPPAWPLDEEPTGEEWRVWTQFWSKPQALIWERDQTFEPVAMFVRQYIEGMVSKASAENRKTVRMMFADLYLTSDSLKRGGYRIAADELSAARTAEAPPARVRSRDRLRAVPSGDGA